MIQRRHRTGGARRRPAFPDIAGLIDQPKPGPLLKRRLCGLSEDFGDAYMRLFVLAAAKILRNGDHDHQPYDDGRHGFPWPGLDIVFPGRRENPRQKSRQEEE